MRTLATFAGLCLVTYLLGMLALFLVVWLVGYLIACWAWPFGSHWWCDGSGKRRSPSGRAWRNCKGCGGSGRKVRLARRVWIFGKDLRS